MAKYNDDLYKDSLNALIGDIYYAEGVSYDAKISRMRKLAEILLRRLLKHNSKSTLELGNPKTKKALEERGFKEPFLIDSLEKIRLIGNDSVHSKQITMPTEDDFHEVSLAVTNLYAYQFFDFFKRYQFGSNPQIVTVFSLLPPSFRFIVLRELVYNGLNNVDVMDKFPKAAIKAFGFNKAMEWIIDNKQKLTEIDSAYTSDDAKETFLRYSSDGYFGIQHYLQEIQNMTGNMYEYMIRMVQQLPSFEERPKQFRYNTFEEAKRIYLENGIVNGDTEDIIEFNNLMRFIYEGRKEAETNNIETLITRIMNDMDDICLYCESWKSDPDYIIKISDILRKAKEDIDGKFEDLI